MQAVRFDQYGDVNALDVREVEDPVIADGEVLVGVRATSINPGESDIRAGVFREMGLPKQFPAGQGSDLAGVVVASRDERWTAGDEVLGYLEWGTSVGTHAELVAVPGDQMLRKPAQVSWDVAATLFVGGTAAVASMRVVRPQPGETILVTAAAGGTGIFTSQLAVRSGARVIGVASERNHEWLRSRGVEPIAHGEGFRERLLAATDGRIDGVVDLFGGGYVALALELGVPKERINTIIDFAFAAEHGIQTMGTSQVASAATVGEVLDAVVAGDVEVPIAATYPLAEVREAFTVLDRRQVRGKIVLHP
ncbi:MAG: NADP-dependent oxidoreductase [Patulibacter sp.]|nr:NADP-dependent oxidoreductase [Patulibacter sp.]